MTPEALADLVRPLSRDLPGVEDPARLLRAVEALADRKPADRAIALAVHGAHALATCGDGVPAIVAGVRREALVRWDEWTATWDGPAVATGAPARVRALRAGASRDPVLRRALIRAGTVVQEALGDLVVAADESPWPALRVALPGAPLSPRADADDRQRPEVLARLIGTAVADFARWEATRIGLPALSPREVLDTGHGLRIVCLTPDAEGEAGPSIAGLARTLQRWWGEGDEGAVEALLDGLATFPPRLAAEAGRQVRDALAQDLAAARHRLRARSLIVSRQDREARLYDAVARLGEAVPPPEGRGPVGVDLEGRITVVESRAGRVRWGPDGEAVLVREFDGNIEVREARRLLRAHAAAPPNPRFAAEVGGTPEDALRICRWVASALQLRTIALLLAAAG